MNDDRDVVLVQATPADHDVLARLLELYTYDLSVVFPRVTLGADGRYGYQSLPMYWSEPAARFAFLIYQASKLVGFVLATRGSPVSTSPDVYDVAEFFVLKKFRRSGIASRAIALLWERMPGAWTVRVSARNVDALPFWTRIVAAHAARPAVIDTTSEWHTFSFHTTPS